MSTWVEGYLSAANTARRVNMGNLDLLAGARADELRKHLDITCSREPAMPLASAAYTLFLDLIVSKTEGKGLLSVVAERDASEARKAP